MSRWRAFPSRTKPKLAVAAPLHSSTRDSGCSSRPETVNSCEARGVGWERSRVSALEGIEWSDDDAAAERLGVAAPLVHAGSPLPPRTEVFFVRPGGLAEGVSQNEVDFTKGEGGKSADKPTIAGEEIRRAAKLWKERAKKKGMGAR